MKTKPILPGSTIGILGGGQLAYYMAIEANNMGYKVLTYDPSPLAPAGRVSTLINGAFDDLDALRQFANQCDLITYEFENMNLEHMEILDKEFLMPQGSKMLKHTAHRYEELKMAQALGIPTVKSVYLESNDYDRSQLHNLQTPLIIKTCRFGYDGKGQTKVDSIHQIDIQVESLVSEFISFEKEVSVLIVRTQDKIEAYPCIENLHRDGILYTSKTLDTDVYPLAKDYASRIAQEMNYIGIMAVEFFVKDGKLIFNEVAPRPHNSGHLTLTVANKSQFKAHIEAICNMEIGSLYYHENAIMLNLLGQDIEKARSLIGKENTYHYEYGKDKAVTNRKMGHVVFTKGTQNLENYKRELSHE